MKARDPRDRQWYYFVDKCLPFGALISCALFQSVSDAVAHIVKWQTNKKPINYLDDFLFLALLKCLCDHQMKVFMEVCREIEVPVKLGKTVWSTTRIIFLGLLIDSVAQLIFLPRKKVLKGRGMVDLILAKRKVTIKELQKLCGFLNFLGRAIVPGRAFMHRLYAYTRIPNNSKLKPHHHVKINSEMQLDLNMWKTFLSHQSVFARPFIDLVGNNSTIVEMYSDASKNDLLGMGAYSQNEWTYTQWESDFISKENPSIEYLELYAVTVGNFLWLQNYKNQHITLFCDNESFVHMVNNTSSSCKNCMVLIRLD